ncbi:MAG: DmsC/YnfH family molybdoenzyme membrane anchor subunit [Fuerstiella sp.]
MDSLIQQLLDEQQDLTAVERFAQLHDGAAIPAQQKHYEHLLPLSPLESGQQFGFQVDLDRCSGCKACVTACHSMNGLDESETWRDVGVLIGEANQLPILQHVTTACHHCLEPACASACPVDAYEKDPVTGIVRHLDDQCFGCQYCTLACPYDVPKYHEKKGIVRKCDMCSDRLADGEAPACVQACPHEAISILAVDIEQLKHERSSETLVGTAPESSFTVPTTKYVGGHRLDTAEVSNPALVKPQHAHAPLVVMLVLSQLSVGMFGALALAELLQSINVAATSVSGATTQAIAVVAFVIGQIALAAATLHLGRPQYAFRAIVGFRHSWLSREILVFGLFTAASGSYVGLKLLPFAEAFFPAIKPLASLIPAFAASASLVLTVLTGAAGIACSAMIYVFTRRQFWSASQAFSKFFGTAVCLGPVVTAVVLEMIGTADDSAGMIKTMVVLAVLSAGIKAGWEDHALKRWALLDSGQLKRTADLAHRDLKVLSGVRFLMISAGILCLLLAFFMPSLVVLCLAAVTLLAGEFCERILFFKAVSPDRMPAGL